MKIRIRGNSIRYRLDKADVALLESTGKVESNTSIGNGTLHFCVKGKESNEPVIKMEPDSIHLLLPLTQLASWYAPDQVGIEFTQSNTDGSTLKILVEKDFKCLIDRDEDDNHSFDNPKMGETC